MQWRSILIAALAAIAADARSAAAQTNPLDNAPPAALDLLPIDFRIDARTLTPLTIEFVAPTSIDLEAGNDLTGSSALLPALYLTFAVAQAADAHSTLTAIEAGATERNPLMEPLSSRPVAFMAVKAAATMLTVYAAHKLSKRHRTAAVIMMLVVTTVYAAAAAHNYEAAKSYRR